VANLGLVRGQRWWEGLLRFPILEFAKVHGPVVSGENKSKKYCDPGLGVYSLKSPVYSMRGEAHPVSNREVVQGRREWFTL
jgi:hypothetical protein